MVTNLTTRLRNMPRRVFDHPLSGAYAAWIALTHTAISQPSGTAASLAAYSTVGLLGAGIVLGRKRVVRQDTVRKMKRLLRRHYAPERGHLLLTCAMEAFETLYPLDTIEAPRTLLQVLRSEHPDLSACDETGVNLAEKLVKLTVLHMVANQSLLTSLVSKKVKQYAVAHYPDDILGSTAYAASTQQISADPLVSVAISVTCLNENAAEQTNAWKSAHIESPVHTSAL